MRRDDVELPVAPRNDRPHDRYRCGVSCAGKDGSMQVCPLGPTVRGRCQHEKEPCIPEPTAHFRAKRYRRAVLVLGLLAVCFGGYFWGGAFYKPGSLSTPHAQILSGKMTSASCAACHPQAERSPLAWFLSGHPGTDAVQSDRCMDCHHTRLPRAFAKTAHNLSPSDLLRLQSKSTRTTPVSLANWVPKPAFKLDDVACAACHREHAGADASLTSLSDAQCQTCHSHQFKSFTEGHPNWSDWPYSASESISFDHRSHAMRHFPSHKTEDGNQAKFDCIRCHQQTEKGDFARVGDYASNCGECHDKALHQQSGQRLDLFVLPSLMEPKSLGIEDWPVAATGFYDGAISPLAKVFLQTTPELAAALKTIPGDGNFARIQPASQSQQDAARSIAVAVRELIEKMASQGPLPAASDLQCDGPELADVLQGLPPQLIWDASQRWFLSPQTPENDQAGRTRTSIFRPAAARKTEPGQQLADDPLLESNDPLLESNDPLLESNDPLLESNDPLLGSEDVLNEDPLAVDQGDAPEGYHPARKPYPRAPNFDPMKMQPKGGWYVDDARMAISYRGFGHADPVLKAAIELAAGLPEDSSIRNDLLRNGPTVGCIQCHRSIASSGKVVWKSTDRETNSNRSLTKFAHGPHMNLPVLADCKHCHRIDEHGSSLEPSVQMSTVSLQGAIASDHDFSPMTKHQCASCHTASAAGDACVKCHNYHTDDIR